MLRIVDNVTALRILKLLITPFNQMDAYRLGVIDQNGNLITKGNLTPQQKDSYTLLHRIVFKIKQLLNRLPGGESQLKNVLAAYMLVRESYENDSDELNENKFFRIKTLLDEGVVFAQEELLLNQFLQTLEEENGGGGAAAVAGASANSVAGGGVAGLTPETGGPVVRKKDIKNYLGKNQQNSPIKGIVRRPKL